MSQLTQKILIIITILTTSFVAQAELSESQKSLARTQSFEFSSSFLQDNDINSPKTLQLSYTTHSSYSVYFWEAYEEVQARVSRTNRDGKTYTIHFLFNSGKKLVSVTLPVTKEAYPKALKIQIKDTERRKPIELNFATYWYNFSYVSTKTVKNPGTKFLVKTPIFADKRADQISGKLYYSGTLVYRACDGCEHGDQFMIADSRSGNVVNVVNLLVGNYYSQGCADQTLHRWLADILKFSVPFTFVGTISALTADLREDHWVAEPDGTLYIGLGRKIPFVRFLDTLVGRIAAQLNREPLEIWEDVHEKGSFADFKGGILTFVYESAQVELNVQTGKIN